jgi:hypothetical protein
MRTQRTFNHRPILLGCLGAAIMGVLSCCALVAVSVSPAMDGSLPPRPVPDPNQEDIAIIVREAYLNRVMSESLPGPMKDAATLDVQPGGLLVITTSIDLVIQELKMTVTLRMGVEDGKLQLALQSIEAGGEDILDLLGVDGEALGQAMSEAIQSQVEAGLGEGAQILAITMDEEHIIITARWAV